MINLTADMLKVADSSYGWMRNDSERCARDICCELGSDFDWDSEAGENWSRLLLGSKVVAVSSMTLPLVFILDEFIERVRRSNVDSLLFVVVPSMDGKILSCDLSVLESVLGGRASSGDLDPSGFSVDDLYFATV
jgi:hypothetical protein